jgi:hypothetical protein
MCEAHGWEMRRAACPEETFANNRVCTFLTTKKLREVRALAPRNMARDSRTGNVTTTVDLRRERRDKLSLYRIKLSGLVGSPVNITIVSSLIQYFGLATYSMHCISGTVASWPLQFAHLFHDRSWRVLACLLWGGYLSIFI